MTTHTLDLVNTIGVNTHFNYGGLRAYAPPNAAKAINFLNVRNIRDFLEKPDSLTQWRAVAEQTGAKFISALPTGSEAEVDAAFQLLPDLHASGLAWAFEGPNEEDIEYAEARKNSAQKAVAFARSRLWPFAQSIGGKPVIAPAFGGHWEAKDDWKGSYDEVGTIADLCNYGNAHTYPGPQQRVTEQLARLTRLAQLAAPARPVIHTEFGFNGATAGNTPERMAIGVLQAIFGAVICQLGGLYFYSLFDNPNANNGQGTKFGLMNDDGSPRPAGIAIHNTMNLLRASCAGTPKGGPMPLTYALIPLTRNDLVAELENTDGSRWLAIWNETDAPHELMITFGRPCAFQIFRPLTSIVAAEVIRVSDTLELHVSGEPQLIKVW